MKELTKWQLASPRKGDKHMLDQEFLDKILHNYRALEGEQETKNNMIEPLLHELGYDIDCIEDVRTEVLCDAGKNNEKVDYVLCMAGKPIIMIEAKDWKEELEPKYINQLFRYFSTSDCKLAILTNGLEYLFFTDLKKENIMDKTPFYRLDIRYLKDSDREMFKKICKVQQCSYPINKYIMEMKVKSFLNKKHLVAEILAMYYFHDPDLKDVVYNAMEIQEKKGG